MTDDRIMEIARQHEAYRDNSTPSVRGADLVLFARQVIDELFDDVYVDCQRFVQQLREDQNGGL